MNDPVVIDPPNFDQKAAWGECRDYVEKCGGLSHEDGEVNWRAAFGADPGICSCPCCPGEHYWAWGCVQQCKKCGFQYPTDWWAMYSWGGQEARRAPDSPIFRGKTHEKYMAHKYYRWAFEHEAMPTMEAAHVVAWKTIFPEDAGACQTCHRCEGDGKAHGADRPFESSGPGTYPGAVPCLQGHRQETKLN